MVKESIYTCLQFIVLMISIVGAGPVGCYLGFLLARSGYSVNIFEEHKGIGLPIHCTGIVTSSISDLVDIPNSCVANRISVARIYSPENNFAEIRFREKNLVLHRDLFDQYLAGKADGSGARILMGHRFESCSNGKIAVVARKRQKTFSHRILVGSDGPNSCVARQANLFSRRCFWNGLQARVKLKNDNAVEFYPFIGSFAWVVPENRDFVRIGLLAKKDLRQEFMKFARFRLKKFKPVGWQAGLVPLYDPSLPIEKGNVFLVGDAAMQVKATTGGGLIPGLAGAKLLASAISDGVSYTHLVQSSLHHSLQTHLAVRKILDRFSHDDYNRIVRYCRQKNVSKVLSEIDRDHPNLLVPMLIIRQPRFLYFLRHLLF
jgi:digeranylgeranylglycerophospholipid reductase